MALHPNVHQGLHGEGYIYALACASGFTSSRMNLDVDGVDWQIACPGPKGTIRSPKIEVQVKTESAPGETSDAYRHELKVAHFNHLAGPGFQVLRFLALVVTPRDPQGYADCDTESMRLRTAAYWLSLADESVLPTDDGSRRSVVVSVPKRNLLCVETLTALLSGKLDEATR